MKTTLVKERIAEIVGGCEYTEGSKPSYCRWCGEFKLSRTHTATQDIQKLINDECIKAIPYVKSIELTIMGKRYGIGFKTITEDGQIVITPVVTELTATESPLKPVKEDI